MNTQEELPKKPLKITDTTLRDGHQSTLATRMRTEDMEPIAAEMNKAGFHSIEVWGGATFDVTTRFLNEDPWGRLRTLKKLMPDTPLQMLLRGQNLVGYRNYPDDVVRAFVHEAAASGMDIFRVFDAVNDERNFEASFKAIKECGKHAQGTICYSLTERHLGGPVYNIDYFVKKALALQDMGADSICIKDMAGLIAPYDAYELVKALKAVLKVPLQLHTHYTSGMASMSVLKAVEAGLDIVDCALAPFALRSSQPAVEPLVVTLQGTPRDTGLDLRHLAKLGAYIESIAPKYRDFLATTGMSVIDTGVLMHQIPGGMISNLVSQLREAGAIDRLEEVYEELPRARKELGYPPLVTPTSQIVGVQAVLNVLMGRYNMISDEIKDYVYGLYGQPPASIDPELMKKALAGYDRGEQPITCRAADVLEPELDYVRGEVKGLARDEGDVLTAAIYPTTGKRFLRWKYGLEDPPASTKPKTMEQIKAEDDLIAKAKAGKLVPKPETEAPPKGPDLRTFNVFVGDKFYQVEVDPIGGRPQVVGFRQPVARPAMSGGAAPAPQSATKPAAAATAQTLTEGEVAVVAPMPGMVIRYEVEVGQKVKAGQPVVILEAMKMQNALPSPTDGTVKELRVAPGSSAARNDILAVIAK